MCLNISERTGFRILYGLVYLLLCCSAKYGQSINCSLTVNRKSNVQDTTSLSFINNNVKEYNHLKSD